MTDSDPNPITCHVLNTLNGTPATGIQCTLSTIKIGDSAVPERDTEDHYTFRAKTNSDGRVSSWDHHYLHVFQPLAEIKEQGATTTTWRLCLHDVGGWYRQQGVESFWSDVTVDFVVHGQPGDPGWRHYHVPVLLGPWSYSTYRGS
jgi:5-hydroxyisourate hydrolase